MTSVVPQTYGIATAGNAFGGPRGVWLECRSCDVSHRLLGCSIDAPDREVAAAFRSHGWTGEGDRMMKALCPRCSARP